MKTIVDPSPVSSAPAAPRDPSRATARLRGRVVPPLSLGLLVLLGACGRGPAPEPQAEPLPAEIQALLEKACTEGTCKSSQLVGHWKDRWNEQAVQRTVRFVEHGAGHFGYEVTDATGAPATLSFETGVPVTLTLVNPGDTTSSGKHYVTAPEFFRTVAWRKAETADAEYKAPTFDAFELLYTPGSTRSMKLYFVPMIAGHYGAYCELGVKKLADGSPDYATGHAGLGMTLEIEVTRDLGVALDAEVVKDWAPGLASDARRSSGHDVWKDGNRDDSFKSKGGAPVKMVEGAAGALSFEPGTLRLKEGKAYVLGFSNAGSAAKHYFTAPELFAASVLRKVEDSHAEIKAPYLDAVELLPGKSADLYLVPARKGEFKALCEIGVGRKADGSFDHATGHAGKGMVSTVIVE